MRQKLNTLTQQKSLLTSINVTPTFVPTPVQQRVLLLPIPKKKKKVIRTKKKAVTTQGYNVKARPLKKKGAKKKPRLVKVNKAPLTKRKAQDLRNYITDTSLSRTATIKRTKGKPVKSKLNVPVNYASRTRKKFRTHRIVKGKRKPLPKGKVIERKRFIGDTKQEKKKLTLRRRISQLEKQSKRKSVSRRTPRRRAPQRKPIKRTIAKKRVLSPAQIRALKRGRQILAKKRKG